MSLLEKIENMNVSNFYLGGFNFNFNNIDCATVVSIATNDLKTKYSAKAKLVIYNQFNEVLEIHITSRNKISILEKNGVIRFYNFFRIRNGYDGDHFNDMKLELFRIMNDAASSDIDDYGGIEEKIVRYAASRERSKDPDMIYCTGAKLNGFRNDGSREQRSDFNDAKTQISRNALYQHYKHDKNISFNYSKEEKDEKTDFEIIQNFNRNNPNYIIYQDI